jgi:signal transduction histidine kinase
MNRLWVRFSLAFMLFVLMGPILVFSIGMLATRTDTVIFFLRSELTSAGSLTDQLVVYYRENGSWEGVEPLVEGYDGALPRGPDQRIFTLVLADEGGAILYAHLPEGVTLDDSTRQEVITITVDGRTRGYLGLYQLPATTTLVPSENGQGFLIRQISAALSTLGIAGAVLGLVGGIIISRSLAAPLAKLEQTARRFGKRDFAARAEVRGSTEMRAVTQAFNEMASDLEQAEARRRNLLADVAHELRTPLSVLQGNLQALYDGVYPLEKDEIARLMQQTDMLTRLVNDLRELAQAEAHQLRLTKTEVDLGRLMRDSANAFRAVANERGVQLVVYAPEAPLMIEAEGGRIQQVLSNLLDNALKHTPADGTVRVMLASEGEHAVLSVADSGSGIAPEHLPHIFDRFYRVDRSRSRDKGGSGLGLAIAKAFVELHGGTIEAQSTGVPGQGTTFSVRLPSVKAE